MSETDTKARHNEPYQGDFYAWTQEQARLLRERRFDELDLDNLVDEVEGVGSSEKNEIRNRLKILLTHLLKWKFQPGRRGTSWRRTIREQRESIAAILEASPSLRGYPSRVMHVAYTGATVSTSEETGLAIGIFPEDSPFSVEETLEPEFFPEDPENE
jgi:hypothetical protein